MPVPMSKVFFNNSGSEANDTAVKLVWYYNNALGRPRKKKIIGRVQRPITASPWRPASLTGLPPYHTRLRPADRAASCHTDCPHYYRYGKPGESEEDFATRMAENLDALIQREGPDTVAAFIAEPVMGAGGVIVPPRDLLRQDPGGAAQARRAVHRRRGDLRLRPHRQHVRLRDLRLKPDIMTMAKALSSAYLPISATVINEKIYQGLRDAERQARQSSPTASPIPAIRSAPPSRSRR